MQIKLYNDIAFKWIFGRQQCTGPLIALINAVLSHENSDTPKFDEVQILNPFDASEPFKHEKQGILDVRAKEVHSGTWVDLEVQVRYSESYPQRSKYYLAGLYRDQLEKSTTENYDELKPVYGIHLLMENLFRGKNSEDCWFNHYTMLNTRDHKPLTGHWHLFFIEMKKCLGQIEKNKGKIPLSPLEEWGSFLGTPQDNTKPLDPALNGNMGIREVYDMLQTFTDQDHLREKYRLQEEFIRAQRTYQAEYENALKRRNDALKTRDVALKTRDDALKTRDDALKTRDDAIKEKEAFKVNAIRKMKNEGLSKEMISQLLGISIDEVEPLFLP